LVVLASPATPVSAEQASFDCLKAALPVEQLICSDPQLLRLDGALGDAFATYRQRLPEKDRAGALAEQRAWLAQRLKQCDVPANSPLTMWLLCDHIGSVATASRIEHRRRRLVDEQLG
jgi:uncharacterized protein